VRAATLSDLKAAFGTARLSSLSDRYLAEGDSAVQSSAALLASGDYPAAQAVLHSFAGASATFGALAIQSLLAQMEADLKAGRGTVVADKHSGLAALWVQTRSEMIHLIAA
jgi:HPt (histidine-containing phosphotransfer) domain-containing protein